MQKAEYDFACLVAVQYSSDNQTGDYCEATERKLLYQSFLHTEAKLQLLMVNSLDSLLSVNQINKFLINTTIALININVKKIHFQSMTKNDIMS